MIFPNVTFSISVTGIHKHSLNFDLRDHHLILYSLLCFKNQHRTFSSVKSLSLLSTHYVIRYHNQPIQLS